MEKEIDLKSYLEKLMKLEAEKQRLENIKQELIEFKKDNLNYIDEYEFVNNNNEIKMLNEKKSKEIDKLVKIINEPVKYPNDYYAILPKRELAISEKACLICTWIFLMFTFTALEGESFGLILFSITMLIIIIPCTIIFLKKGHDKYAEEQKKI